MSRMCLIWHCILFLSCTVYICYTGINLLLQNMSSGCISLLVFFLHLMIDWLTGERKYPTPLLFSSQNLRRYKIIVIEVSVELRRYIYHRHSFLWLHSGSHKISECLSVVLLECFGQQCVTLRNRLQSFRRWNIYDIYNRCYRRFSFIKQTFWYLYWHSFICGKVYFV